MVLHKTIIYYTSNREDPKFEKRIQANLLKNCGDLPIISVSQKPIKLGTNICVGDVGVSGFNMFRQVEIALRACKTKFVISAEADCMYPPDYFKFTPKKDNVPYRNSNLYVMPDRRAYWFYKKEGATHSQIVGRKFYLKTLERLFEGEPEWDTEQKNFPKEKFNSKKEDVFEKVEYYQTENPVFQVKTHRGMRYYTNSERIPIYDLPYWGNGKQVRKELLHGVK